MSRNVSLAIVLPTKTYDTASTPNFSRKGIGDTLRKPKLRRNGDGRGFAVIPQSGGKRTYFGEFGSTECERKYQTWLASLVAEPVATNTASGRQTIPKAVSLYLVEVKKRYSTTEYNGVYLALERLVVFHRNTFVDQITVADLRQLLIVMSNEVFSYGDKPHSTKRTYSRQYINKTHSRIKRFFKWCHLHGYTTVEQFSRISVMGGLWKNETEARETNPKADVSLSTVRKTLPHLTKTVAAMVQVQYLCGMRPQDVCGMRPADIDRSSDVWLYIPVEHKNTHRGLQLMKAVPPAAQALLNQFEPADAADYYFSPKRSIKSEQPTASANRLSRLSRKYSSSAYHHAVRDACVKAKVERWTPNQLRHAIATYLRAKYGQEHAQYYLGHNNISTTDIYAHRAEQKLKEIGKDMPNPFSD